MLEDSRSSGTEAELSDSNSDNEQQRLLSTIVAHGNSNECQVDNNNNTTTRSRSFLISAPQPQEDDESASDESNDIPPDDASIIDERLPRLCATPAGGDDLTSAEEEQECKSYSATATANQQATAAEEEVEEDQFDPLLWISLFHQQQLGFPKPIRVPVLPKKEVAMAERPTLVLDLDETLVHCTVEPVDKYDFTFPVLVSGTTYTVYVRCRPGYLEFLEYAAKHFEVVIFTASRDVYASALLDLLDPERRLIK
jgi:hypothetical protein